MKETGRSVVIGPKQWGAEIESMVEMSVVVTETTADGVSHLRTTEREVDCVVVDHDPPDCDGFSVLEAVSQTTPVIVAPNGGNSKLATEALQAGATSYIDRATVGNEAVVEALESCLTGDLGGDEQPATTGGGRGELPDAVDERLEKATSMLSHELRGPIQRASSGIDLARTECESEYLDEVAETLGRMDRLIDTLLDQLKHDTAPELEPVDLAAAVDDAWVDGTPATLTVESALPTIVAEETRLRQLLENLFRNAVQHAGDNVTVRIGVFESGGTDDAIGLYVADDGPGIESDHREIVFEYGYTGADDGTGYGLGIVAEIAETFGWAATVTESRDGGARFELVGIKTV